MTRTLTGIIIHWPDSDISSLLEEENSHRMVSAILRELPQHPFQEGQELTSTDTSAGPAPESGSSGSRDPRRQVFAGSRGSANTPPRARNLEEEFRDNGGIFESPTANIISARHILDTLEPSPALDKAKEILAAIAVQVNHIMPLPSLTKVQS